MKNLTYKCHTLAINELPNFKNPQDELYRGTTIIDGRKWEKDGSAVYLIESWFRDKIDNLYRGRSYAEVFKAWNGRYKRIEYKGRWLSITVRERFKDNKIVYLGEFCNKDYRKNKSVESVHYNKVVSKFEKFVDEYCTDWVVSYSKEYEGYTLVVKKERDQWSPFFGTCEIHKNSTFKCISNSVKELEDKFITRVDQILYHKQGIKVVNPKEDRLKQLEIQIAKLQQEFEKIKNEKDKELYVYKGLTLEITKENEEWYEAIIINDVKNLQTFSHWTKGQAKEDFEKYIDELEESASLYCQLTGKSINGTT